MRRFFFFALAIILILGIAGVAAGALLAQTGLFLPGSPVFLFQDLEDSLTRRLHLAHRSLVPGPSIILPLTKKLGLARNHRISRSIARAFLFVK